MKDLIRLIAQALVDTPERVNVTEIKGNNTSVFELTVAKGDAGKVIGRQGRTAQALRTILSAVGAKEKKRIAIQIID